MSDNPLGERGPWELVAEGYASDTQPQLAPYSLAAIELVAPAADARVLDVACGTGTTTLELAPRVDHVTAVDFAANMVELLREQLAVRRIDNVEAWVMDGQDLDLADDSYDAAFSMFGLMFFPDRARGLAELRRTLVPGGRVAVSTWCRAERSPCMQLMLGSLRAAVPELPAGGSISALDTGEALVREMTAAGFRDVAFHEVTRAIERTSAEEAWGAMDRGAVPFVMLREQLGDEEWERRSARGIEFLAREASFPAAFESTAFVGVGTR